MTSISRFSDGWCVDPWQAPWGLDDAHHTAEHFERPILTWWVDRSVDASGDLHSQHASTFHLECQFPAVACPARVSAPPSPTVHELGARRSDRLASVSSCQWSQWFTSRI